MNGSCGILLDSAFVGVRQGGQDHGSLITGRARDDSIELRDELDLTTPVIEERLFKIKKRNK